MSGTAARLGAFLAALVLVFLGAYAVGSAVGPLEPTAPPSQVQHP